MRGSVDVMVTGEAAYRVDLDELDAASTALARVLSAAQQGRASLRDAADSGDGWAVDGQLPWALERLCGTLGWAVDQVHDLCGSLHAAVVAAAQEYAEAEASARLDPRDAAAATGR
jgi:hypothetical protein